MVLRDALDIIAAKAVGGVEVMKTDRQALRTGRKVTCHQGPCRETECQ